MSESWPLLEVKDLRVAIPSAGKKVYPVNGISYTVKSGEVMGIVGESGSGKSMSSYAVMRLLKDPIKVESGEVLFNGKNLLSLNKSDMEAYRGSQISMIFQDPLTCLDPVFTIGEQLTETLHAHEEISDAEARKRAVEMLRSVSIRNPEEIMHNYPYEISGGMRQRVMIAIVLLCRPKLLIADEPTTALDVTTQAQILRLLKRLKKENGMSMVFITHNFGVVANICDRVSVMYGGHIVEQGMLEDIFNSPRHPYTQAILRALPKSESTKGERMETISGEPINLIDAPSGCPFNPRCPFAKDICRREYPGVTAISDTHIASCHLLAGGASDEQ